MLVTGFTLSIYLVDKIYGEDEKQLMVVTKYYSGGQYLSHIGVISCCELFFWW